MMTRNARSPVLAPLVAVRTVEALASSALLPFVVLWAHHDAGLAGVAAGALFLGQAAGEFGAGVTVGGIADRLGRRRVLVTSTTGVACSYALLALCHSPVPAIVLFVLSGVFESAFHPTVAAMVGDAVPAARLPHAFSVLRVGVNTGRIVGPLLGALIALASLPLVFAVGAALLALGLVVELTMLPKDPPGARSGDDDAEVPPGTLRAIRRDRGLAALVLGGGLLAVTFTWWESDGLVVIRTQTALSATTFAGLLSFAALLVVVAQLPVTRVARRLPERRVLLLGALVQAVGLAELAAAHWGLAVLASAVALMTLGEMLYSPVVSTLVTRRAAPNQRASYQAALSITEDIGTAVGPISGLALARTVTAAGLWTCGAALSSLAARISSSARADRTASPSPALTIHPEGELQT